MSIEEDNIDFTDYFFTKYNSDISDLFLKIKEISNGYCVNLFNNNYQTRFGTNDLMEFIFENIILEDEIKDLEDNTDNKNMHELELEENNM